MQATTHIDINADLGEGGSFDELIMPLISSCNIAIGGHSGDEISIRKTIRLAKQHQVKIGAHPGFPDKEYFGRRMLELKPKELRSALKDQLDLFKSICMDEEVVIHHIKAHGALYNEGSQRTDYVDIMLDVFQQISPTPQLYCQADSLLMKKAKDHFPIRKEAFIDRQYETPNQLRSREKDQALITDSKAAWEHLERMFQEKKVKLFDGSLHPFHAETFCIHGDHPESLDVLRYIRQQLNERGISVQ